ncbi:MAG: PIN domain-containing protein [Planctomycetes bacterium]|nr:PIN domain-containing protein [Planctomycetota bacterium]
MAWMSVRRGVVTNGDIMRNSFRGYYAPTDDERKKLWNEGVFVLDANVLLNIYRVREQVARELLRVLENLRDRIWVPHQAGLEFHRNRLSVISEQVTAYEALEKALGEGLSSLKKEVDRFSRHPFLDVSAVLKEINSSVDKVKQNLQTHRTRHPNLIQSDPLLDRLTAILEGRVEQAFTPDQLQALYKEGQARFDNETPPGFRDKAKPQPERYGDFILWKQILAIAGREKKPIILVTDDLKEDWWRVHRGLRVGPRPEIVDELHATTGVMLAMYSSDRFLERAREILKVAVSTQSVEEIKEAVEERLRTSGEAARLEVGDHVRHPRFGRGVLEAIAPPTVRFRMHGLTSGHSTFLGQLIKEEALRPASAERARDLGLPWATVEEAIEDLVGLLPSHCIDLLAPYCGIETECQPIEMIAASQGMGSDAVVQLMRAAAQYISEKRAGKLALSSELFLRSHPGSAPSGRGQRLPREPEAEGARD